MPIKYINNWNNNIFDDIIDVRSPVEFEDDHIPNSINLPVLNNIQRVKIGTIYKEKNAFTAKKLGASYISENISKYLKNDFLNKPGSWKPVIYCWRGGQRSKAIATVLSEIGWLVYVLKGGYKTYRTNINQELNKFSKRFKFIVIKGPTGCAKTKILKILEEKKIQTLDLEGIACHKGSLIGNIPNKKQPSQKLFESKLYFKLKKLSLKSPIFIESESSKIGQIFLPQTLIQKIKISPSIEITTSVKERVNYLVKDYKDYLKLNNSFKELFKHAKKIVGYDKVKRWRNLYNKQDWYALANLLIIEYYDPLYKHNLKRKNNKIVKQYNNLKLNSKGLNIFCQKLIHDLEL